MIVLVLAACRTVVGPDTPPPGEDPSIAWGEVLALAVTPEGLVDYDRLEADRDVLDAYVAWAGVGRVPRERDAEAAFWLNARTADVLWLVLHEGRPASVYEVQPTAFWPVGSAFFRQRAFRSGAERLSIGEIDDERLRLTTQDIRIHSGLYRATRSGPPARSGLWLAGRLDEQLQDQMGRWVSDPVRGVRIEQGTAVFDAAFEDYGRDFAQWTAGDDLCTMAARFAWGDLRADLRDLAAKGCPHRFAPPDLALDDRSRYE